MQGFEFQIRVALVVTALLVMPSSPAFPSGAESSGGFPPIAVDPLVLASSQPPDTSVNLSIEVSNTGLGDLDWSVAEAPGDCSTPGDVPWVAASPTAGTTPASSTDTVEVTFDSTGLAPGVYSGLLCVASNDLANPLVSVDLTLEVGAPQIVVDPLALASTQPPESVALGSFEISNVGGADLDWSVAEAPGDCSTPGDVPWVGVSPTAGLTPVSSTDIVDLVFDSTGLVPGVYTFLLCVASNDGDDPLVEVSVVLTVGVVPTAVVPALSGAGLGFLALLLAMASMRVLRRSVSQKVMGSE